MNSIKRLLGDSHNYMVCSQRQSGKTSSIRELITNVIYEYDHVILLTQLKRDFVSFYKDYLSNHLPQTELKKIHNAYSTHQMRGLTFAGKTLLLMDEYSAQTEATLHNIIPCLTHTKLKALCLTTPTTTTPVMSSFFRTIPYDTISSLPASEFLNITVVA